MKTSTVIYLIGLVAIPFLFVAFLPFQEQSKEWYGVYAYFYHSLEVITRHSLLFIIGFASLTVIILRKRKVGDHDSWYTKFVYAPLHAGIITILGITGSFITLLIIAFVELNTLAIIININPQIIGVTTDKKEIIAKLEEHLSPPEIITSNTSQRDILNSIAVASTGKQSFYGRYVIQSIPREVTIPINTLSTSIALIDNTLIFTQAQKEDFETMGPVIGYLMVKQSFSQRPIKAYPKVLILDKEQYAVLRKYDAAHKLDQIDKEIAVITSEDKKVENEVLQARTTIAQTEEQIISTNKTRDEEYAQCISKGTYVKGKFQRENSPEECKELRNQYSETVRTLQKKVKTQEQQILGAETTRDSYEFYQTFLTQQKTISQIQSSRVPREFGIYDPAEQTIRLALYGTESQLVSHYFNTLVHEYLHYASFINNEKRLYSSFFEEGLTEYFARKAIQDNLQISMNQSYPAHIKIITEMTRRIPEVDFADVYFSKDEESLKQLLDMVYGEGFYTETLLTFEKIHYSSDAQEVLSLSNDIMKRVGGAQLTINDIVSSPSSL